MAGISKIIQKIKKSCTFKLEKEKRMYLFLISTKALSLAVYLFDHSVSLELNWLIDFA